MKVLVTGASGFIGTAIVKKLTEAGCYVIPTGRRDENLANYVKADITDPTELENIGGDFDVVVHAAGLAHQFRPPNDPQLFDKVNAEGARNVARLAVSRGAKHFVLISSIAVYGEDKPAPCTEEAPCRPSGDYAESKYQGELAVLKECGAAGISVTILRTATVYGKGDPGNIMRLIKTIDARRFIWIGKGANLKTMIHVEDLAESCLEVARHGSGSNVYNVAQHPATMSEVVETIARHLKLRIPKLYLPAGAVLAAVNLAAQVPGLGSRVVNLRATINKWLSVENISAEKIEREIGFVPKIHLAEGLWEEIADYQKNESN
jgi:nucleoside-diphosphate-sugar epimerase